MRRLLLFFTIFSLSTPVLAQVGVQNRGYYNPYYGNPNRYGNPYYGNPYYAPPAYPNNYNNNYYYGPGYYPQQPRIYAPSQPRTLQYPFYSQPPNVSPDGRILYYP